ncbi:GntR family transcriptional regulator [Actinomadura citrea]|uniref:GntR family transcriptional regulator n=1 Tax=Actinomadura citrea TaxID=46158 RepID=A0A7Y9GC71_9ACTN|nr:GntR family transcriptional regulator [Actinomadura citrea]NYE13843.1 GntR family transcriptional regulator [Actinomadura citrea]GGT98744.1 transcriptional regulator [Actinomadura citrea]
MPSAGEARTASTKRQTVRRELLAMLDGMDVGDALPSERRLAEELGVSRPTLRQAIDGLVAEGLLDRRHGSGTYLAEPRIAVSLTMTSFTEDMIRRGMKPGGRVLSFRTETAGARIGRRLALSPVEEVFTIRRLRLADEAPMAIETLYLPRALMPDLRRSDLEGRSFYDLLRGNGVVIASGTETIEPTVTTAEEAAELGVPVHMPAFLFERITRDAGGRPLEYVRSLYRGDRYRLELDLRPPSH